MRSVNKPTERQLVNFLGGFGYLTVAFEWLFLLLAFLLRFYDTSFGKIVFPRQQAEIQPQPDIVGISGASSEPDFVTVFLVTAIAVVALGFIFYLVVFRYTKAISDTGARVVRSTAKRAVPIIAHKPTKELSSKRRMVLSRRVMFWTKVILALTPAMLLPIILRDEYRGVSEQTAIALQGLFALIALLVFLVQTWLIRRWHVRANQTN